MSDRNEGIADRFDEETKVHPNGTLYPTFEGLMNFADMYQDALFMEAEAQKAYIDAQALTEYRRNQAVADAYAAGLINGGNEPHRKIQAIRVVDEDRAVAHLQWYEGQALKVLTLAAAERKRIESEMSLTKAWLYSQSGLAVR